MTSGTAAAPRDRQSDVGPYAPLRELSPLPAGWRSLPRAYVYQARALWSQTAMADSTGASLTFGQTLIRALALGRVLARHWGPAEHVGLMVPPTVPAAVANLAVSLWGKVPGQPQLLRQPGAGRRLDRPVRDHARADLAQGARPVQDHARRAS